jgi:hypothetical protein
MMVLHLVHYALPDLFQLTSQAMIFSDRMEIHTDGFLFGCERIVTLLVERYYLLNFLS